YKQVNTAITSWAEDDRPREKLMLQGRTYLSDAELLAVVIGSATKNKSADKLAQEILQSCHFDLYLIGKLTINELIRFKGIGKAKAISIMAVLELGRRRASKEVVLPPVISTAEHAYQIIKPFFQDLEHEEFRILGLTKSNRLIAHKLISIGGRAGTVAD